MICEFQIHKKLYTVNIYKNIKTVKEKVYLFCKEDMVGKRTDSRAGKP